MSAMDVPLVAQDHFFHQLNLKSVHRHSAQFHYRQTLQSRLRSASKSGLANCSINNNKMTTMMQQPPVEQQMSERPGRSSLIQVRHCYYRPVSPKPSNNSVTINVRLQDPAIQSPHTDWERRVAAAIALFTPPRSRDLVKPVLSRRLLTKDRKPAAAAATSLPTSDRCDIPRPDSGHQEPSCSSKAPITLIPRGSRPLLHRKAKIDSQAPARISPNSKVADVASKLPDDVSVSMKKKQPSSLLPKPVWLVQKQVQQKLVCDTCGQHLGQRSGARPCSQCNPWPDDLHLNGDQMKKSAVSALLQVERVLRRTDNHQLQQPALKHCCQVCHKQFSKRSRMIHHVTHCHAAVLHKVDLKTLALASSRLLTSVQP